MKPRIQHRWDRPFKEEASFGLPRDWKREDRNLPDEDEVELPRALNIRRLTAQSLEEVAKASVLVVAMRYPWCTACEEKDK
ncbi:pdiA, partial [Symbiodinium pilosum]